MSDPRDLYKLVRELDTENEDSMNLYDSVDLELSENFVIETGIVGFKDDGIILEADEATLEFLDLNGAILNEDRVVIKESENPVIPGAINQLYMKKREYKMELSKKIAQFNTSAIENISIVKIIYYLDSDSNSKSNPILSIVSSNILDSSQLLSLIRSQTFVSQQGKSLIFFQIFLLIKTFQIH